MAQLAERLPSKQKVLSSILNEGIVDLFLRSFFLSLNPSALERWSPAESHCTTSAPSQDGQKIDDIQVPIFNSD